MAEDLKGDGTSRREVLKGGLFVAPVILTLAAVPSFASAGSDPSNNQQGQNGQNGQNGQGGQQGGH